MVHIVNLSLEMSILCKICLSFIRTMWQTGISVNINVSNSRQKPPEFKNNASCFQMSAICLLVTVSEGKIRNLREDHFSWNVNIPSTSRSTVRWVLPNGLRVTNYKPITLILLKWVLLLVNYPTIFYAWHKYFSLRLWSKCL
jgi:hypothetical protein